MSTMEWVDIQLVEEPTHILRPVNREDPEFLGLVESMRKDGYKAEYPIAVTKEPSKGGGHTYVMAGDGMHRRTGAEIAGLKQIPVVVIDKKLSDEERLERAIVAEATHVQARPVEYGRAITKLVAAYEKQGLTKVAMAIKLRQDPAFLDKCLKLSTLDDVVGEMVDNNEISLGNAQSLVRLQTELSRFKLGLDDAVIQMAKRESVPAFAAECERRILEMRKGPRTKKEPAARIRPLADLRTELDRAVKDPGSPAGYVQALCWALRKDAVSAAMEGAQAPKAGTPEEAPALRAEVAQLEAALEGQLATVKSLQEAVRLGETHVARLQLELEQKDAIIDEFRKGRTHAAK